MAKTFAAGGKMKNEAEKKSKVTAAIKPLASSGLKRNLKVVLKFRLYRARGKSKASCSLP